MGKPSKQQIAEAVIHSAQSGESDAEFDARIAGLSRMSDAELAAVGVPREPPSAATPVRSTAGAARTDGESRPTTTEGVSIDITAARDGAPDAIDPPAIAFTPVPVRNRYDGWTAGRQRAFIAALAETGCVSEACAEVGITARSAYRLREHPAGAAFRFAWEQAQSIATVRLTAIAWERAVHGTPDRIYKDGVLVLERRKPRDKLLMWLLTHHDPVTFGWASRPPGHAPDLSFFRVQHARAELAGHLANIADVPPAECPAEAVPSGGYLDLDEASGA